jgi:hypothetical protein
MRRPDDCRHCRDRFGAGEGTVRYSRSNEHPEATVGHTLSFPSRATHAEPRALWRHLLMNGSPARTHSAQPIAGGTLDA